MGPTTKILIGAGATAMLASVHHGPLGAGQGFVDSLGVQAQAAVASVPGIAARIDDAGMLRRGAILSGPASAAQQAMLLARVEAIPGMAWARWSNDGKDSFAADASIELPASATTVAQCQDGVDALIAPKHIQFDVGTAELTDASAGLISDIASALENCGGTRIEVSGHTDRTGNQPGNQKLSDARAAAVVAALVAKGVPADRLIAKGYGASRPIAKGDSAEANARNRRIEFHVASTSDVDPS